jgi:hypothetical protein
MFSKYFKNVLKISFDFEKKKLDEKPYKNKLGVHKSNVKR